MAHLLESDAVIYKKLCFYLNSCLSFPGADQMAVELGYKTGQSVRDGLKRLENAGYIEIKGVRQISCIIFCSSGLRLSARRKINVPGRRFN